MNGRQTKFLAAMLESGSVSEAAERAGISRTTAQGYVHSDEFQREYQAARSQLVSDAVQRMLGYYSKALSVLEEIIEDPELPAQTRLNAVNSLFTHSRAMYDSVLVQDALERVEAMEASIRNER